MEKTMEEKKPPGWASPTSSASAPSDPPAPGPADNQYTQWHEVVSGDSLWKIAKKYYGDANQWRRIFEANRDQIENPDRIQPGWKLAIPPKA
jgi:nucleoid-associated protein YgaU